MAILAPLGVNSVSGMTQKHTSSDTLSGIPYFLAGSVAVVNPTAPNAADNGDLKTPFITIQAAVNAVSQYGAVFIAPGDYAENIDLDTDTALIGMANQYLTGWNAGYAYNSGRIRVPSSATGTYFLIQNLYLENNTSGIPVLQTDKTVHMNLVNSTLYNNNADAGAHAIHHTAGLSSYYRFLKVETSSLSPNKDFKTDVALSATHFADSYLGGASILNGNITGERSTFSGENTQAAGYSLFHDCRFYNGNGTGSFFDATGGDFTFSRCHFVGNCDYIVDSTTTSSVSVNNPTFGDTASTETGFKGVGGSAILYRMDSHGETLLNKVKGISGTAVATTNLLSTPDVAGYKVVVTRVVLRIASATGLTGTLAAGVGVAAGEDDIFGSTTLTGFSSVDDIWTFVTDGKSKYVPHNATIKLGIDTAFGGTVTLDAEIHGYVVRV